MGRLLAAAGQPAPPPGAVLAAAGAGCAEVVGFAALYRSMAMGPMSVVAPLSSVLPGRGRARVAPGAILAAASALGFDLFFVSIDHAARVGGVAWAVSVTRATSLTALVLAIAVGRRGVACCAGDLRAAGIVGLLDAGANALFALALTEGLASTVSVIGSLYPVTTVVLATVLLRERPRAVQALGHAAVLVGVGLVSACSGA